MYCCFHLLAGDVGVHRDVIDVQLERIGAGLLHLAGVLEPAAGGGAVEAGNDGNFDRLFALGDVHQVGLRPHHPVEQVGKMAGGLGGSVVAFGDEAIEFVAVDIDLLLEERMQDHGRRARVFKPTDVAHFVAHGRGRCHQRVFEFQPEVRRGKVDGFGQVDHFFTSSTAAPLLRDMCS